MRQWQPTPPPASDLGDRDVALEGTHLSGRRIALLVTGSIAALKTPLVARALRRQGATVRAFVSQEGARYVALDALAWATNQPVVTTLSPQAEHLSGEEAFDAYLVAPATYSTIGKMAQGIADTPVTSALACALGRLGRGESAVLVAPAMHGSMHNAILEENLRRLQGLGVRVIAPREACGKHNLPDEGVLVHATCAALSASPLGGRRVLVTGGPIPAMLDGVRVVSSPFTGALAIEIARDLLLRGAEVDLVLGNGSAQVPSWIPFRRVGALEEYRGAVLGLLSGNRHAAAVLSAAVADFAPARPDAGKRPTDAPWQVTLEPTPKVIDEVRGAHPSLPLVGFKYTLGLSEEQALAVARERAARDGLVVLNRGEEMSGGEHPATIIGRDGSQRRVSGKPAIAQAIAEALERYLPDATSAARNPSACTSPASASTVSPAPR